jgi:pyridoxal/pyridoxine/pyridoxamine kinase
MHNKHDDLSVADDLAECVVKVSANLIITQLNAQQMIEIRIVIDGLFSKSSQGHIIKYVFKFDSTCKPRTFYYVDPIGFCCSFCILI